MREAGDIPELFGCGDICRFRRWWLDLRQFSTLLFVILYAYGANHFKAFAGQQIACCTGAASMIRRGQNDAVFWNQRQIIFQIGNLNAEIHGKAANLAQFVGTPQINDQQFIRLRQQRINVGAIEFRRLPFVFPRRRGFFSRLRCILLGKHGDRAECQQCKYRGASD